MVDSPYISWIESLEKKHYPQFDESWLQETLNKYPCFHGANLMHAIYLKNQNEQQFEEALPHLAVRVNNRAVLYDRVHEPYGMKQRDRPKVKAKTKEEEAIVAKSPQQNEEKEDLKSLVQAIRTKRKEHPIETKVERKPKNIESAVNKNKLVKKRDKKAAKKKTLPKTAKPKATGSFTDWLKHQKPVDTTSPQVPIDLTASNEAELILEGKRSSYKLEDFLVKQIQRKQEQKGEIKSGDSRAVSETYAEILTNQGKIEEAIEIYKELSIKYPKKSSTFARQIEKLKSS